jgi:two-component system sensor histidine kinase/response regulator
MPTQAHDREHPDAHQADALRVLVVDDSAVGRVLAEAALVELGHVCATARDGHQALQQVLAQDWDLVVSDLQMPGMDGLALARTLRSLPGERGRLPLIALTAEDPAHSRTQCRTAGFDEWLAKPIDTMALAAAIERVQAARSARTGQARSGQARTGQARGAISRRAGGSPARPDPGQGPPARG